MRRPGPPAGSPTGTSCVADGGSRAAWITAAGHCSGAVLGGEEDLGIRVFLVPRSDVRIDDDSWRVVGLAGTGSKDVDVAGAVVPAHRTHLIASSPAAAGNGQGGRSTPIRCTGCHG